MRLTARTRVAAAVLAGAGMMLLAAAPASAGSLCAGAAALCPNLQTVDPGQGWLHVDRRGSRGNRRVLVHLSNQIGNLGPGPLELTSSELEPSDSCVPAGADPDLYRDVEQRIYADDPADAGSEGFFDRDDDTGRNTVAIGCYFFHSEPGHNHWHFQDFAEYRLEALGGAILGEQSKVGFCVFDGIGPMTPPPSGTPGSYYSSSGCNNPDDPAPAMGLSIGWADRYSAFTPGQRIRVEGLKRGKYCLVSTANPAARIHEESSADNDRRVRVEIRPRREQIEELPEAC